MLKILDVLFQRNNRNPDSSIEPESSSRWIVNLPDIGNVRLGPFNTKEEALDRRREYIIRKLTETNVPIELPF